MKEIRLTKGKVALVDDADFEWLNQWKWWAYESKRKGIFYAQRGYFKNGKRVCILMHRAIIDTPPGLFSDHIDGNGLNNQRNNLRICTHRQNNMNAKSITHSSIFKGVFVDRGRFRASMSVNGKTVHIGFYKDEILAAKAYDEAAIKHQGAFARPNFER